tara:strand:- start:21 stop:272 length:252 start_codon:yes stop_codon:yes gene_type:complete
LDNARPYCASLFGVYVSVALIFPLIFLIASKSPEDFASNPNPKSHPSLEYIGILHHCLFVHGDICGVRKKDISPLPKKLFQTE